MQWEYMQESVDNLGRLVWEHKEWNDLGKQGWELVAVSDGVAYFKRPLKVDVRKKR